jgi:hypothetical protein
LEAIMDRIEGLDDKKTPNSIHFRTDFESKYGESIYEHYPSFMTAVVDLHNKVVQAKAITERYDSS